MKELISPRPCSRAQNSSKIAMDPNRVSFTFADMTSFSFPIKFDLIIAPYFALNYLPNCDAVMKTFVRVAEHLLTGGIFAMHLANVGRLARPLSQEATSSVVVPYDSAGSRLALDILERNFEQSTGKFTQILRYAMIRPDGSTEPVSAERLTYRAIQKEELDDAAAHAGLCSSIMDLEAADTGSFVAFRALTTQPFLRGNAKLYAVEAGTASSPQSGLPASAQNGPVRAIVLARQDPQISPAAAGEMASPPSASTPAAVNALRLMSV